MVHVWRWDRNRVYGGIEFVLGVCVCVCVCVCCVVIVKVMYNVDHDVDNEIIDMDYTWQATDLCKHYYHCIAF